MSGEALILDQVTKRFGDLTAVRNLSARIPRGSLYGFLGPNGAGKTTTIRMIMSIFYQDEGHIEVLGDRNPERVKDRLGYLPEERGLYKKMEVIDLIVFFGRLKGMPSREARKKGLQMLEVFGLKDWADKKCEALSKGMGQKVQIISTLLHDPDLVILDEPFSGLDPVNSEMLKDVILRMKREGKTVIFSTHVMEQAELICDSILLINKGDKILDGPLGEVKSRYAKGVMIDYEGDGRIFQAIPLIERVKDSGMQAELFLKEGVDPQALLAALVGKIRIRRFDLREPSLQEVFIRAVGGDAGA